MKNLSNTWYRSGYAFFQLVRKGRNLFSFVLAIMITCIAITDTDACPNPTVASPINETFDRSFDNRSLNVTASAGGESQTVSRTWRRENLTSTYGTAFVAISPYDREILLTGNIVSHAVEENAVLHILDIEVLSFESFPNPFRSEFKVELNSPLKSESVLKLEDIFGQLVRKEKLAKGQSSVAIDGSTLLPGAYFLSI